MAGRGRIRVENSPKRVRPFLGGIPVADSTNVKLVWEKPWYPRYYFPADDVRTDLMVPTGETKRSPSRGEATLFTIKTDRKEAPAAALHYADPKIEELTDHWTFEWDALDQWFEEDEEVFVHAKDPYTRVDILRSARRVQVVVDGVEVADSDQPTLLLETNLPLRYYLPKTQVRMDLLVESTLETRCPYKGTAKYYHVDVGGKIHENIVWWYPTPTAESARIAGLVSFYNEKVDIYVDGELQERPKSPFA